MRITTELNWEDLPHHDRVGYGREGLVLRLSENECIKIYSPLFEASAESERYNLGRMLDANLIVPQPKEVVRIIANGTPIALPSIVEGKLELVPLREYRVLGLVREYIAGTVVGSVAPSITQVMQLLTYVDRASVLGFFLGDTVPANFVNTREKLYCIDCTQVKTANEFFDQTHFEEQVAHTLQVLLQPGAWDEKWKADDLHATLERVRRIFLR